MSTRSVVVTGASTGIGAAVASDLAARGWQVFAGVRQEADAHRLLESAAGRRIVPVHLDVTKDADVDAALQQVGAAVKDDGLQGLVNNAGVARGGPIEGLPLEEWRSQFDVNVFGQVAVTQAALRLLRRGHGRVVFIGSIGGRVTTPLLAPYAASKHAIEAIGDALREELRPWGIKVAVVEPGAVKTPIWTKGRATVDDIESQLTPEIATLYRNQLHDIRRSIDKNDARGTSPTKVAAAVAHALTSDRPRPRYLVGMDALVAANLTRLLPDRLRIPVLRRLMAL